MLGFSEMLSLNTRIKFPTVVLYLSLNTYKRTKKLLEFQCDLLDKIFFIIPLLKLYQLVVTLFQKSEFSERWLLKNNLVPTVKE